MLALRQAQRDRACGGAVFMAKKNLDASGWVFPQSGTSCAGAPMANFVEYLFLISYRVDCFGAVLRI